MGCLRFWWEEEGGADVREGWKLTDRGWYGEELGKGGGQEESGEVVI